MAMKLKEGDEVRVKVIEPNYQLGGSEVRICRAQVISPKITPLNFRERIVDFILGNRVSVRFTDDNVISRVRSRMTKN